MAITFTKPMAKHFVEKYNDAIRTGDESFLFRSGEYFTTGVELLINSFVQEGTISGKINSKTKIFIYAEDYDYKTT